jgi:hypothetical protein
VRVRGKDLERGEVWVWACLLPTAEHFPLPQKILSTAEHFFLPRNVPKCVQLRICCAFAVHLRKPSRRLTTQSTATRSIDRPSVRAIERAIERSSDRAIDRAMKRTGLVFLLFLDGLRWMLCFALAFWMIRLCIWLVCLFQFRQQVWTLQVPRRVQDVNGRIRVQNQNGVGKVSILQKSAYCNLHGCCLKPGAFAARELLVS